MTPRQEQVQELHAQGHSTIRMAKILGLTRQRVCTLQHRLKLTPHYERLQPGPASRKKLNSADHRHRPRKLSTTQQEQSQAVVLRRSRVFATIRREPFIPTKALASILGVDVRTIQNDIRVGRGVRDPTKSDF
jgi:transposase